ncbi:hypothetical protein TEA_007940 [Camellia sinensis var. sinensis]|uniref:Cytochrome P450 94A1 n=1 Tax=Camellia sinensis var. sinensis TaxID=542762 RepID=A0A4S4EYL3_CAMSN|nr:hypothetical protein TEA_007940 [Camellia sinensis var. sinensis]
MDTWCSIRVIQWTSVTSTPTSTFVLNRPLGRCQVITANPSNVQHILKTHFHIYHKGIIIRTHISDLLGDGIFNVDGENWKFQRQVASHEFNTKSLRKFVETVVDTELSDRLIPILSSAAANKTVLDFQDILQRFAFDNICKIAFGHDPAYLLPSLPQEKFAVAFDTAARISGERFRAFHPLFWKTKRFLDIGSEKQLQFLLMNSGHSDENFVTDIVISFILAGRDTTSAALTWFFWLISRHPDVENEILKEINEESEAASFEEVKNMVYTHASLSESMRLYPPVPVDGKEAVDDDVLPDGTVIKKGTRVSYHPYAMGRSEKLWGSNWAEFRPERWLDMRDAAAGKWSFVARDPYTYPVSQAGPRICLGKDMAFLMKRVVSGVLRRFRVVPAFEEGVEPVFMAHLTSKMKGGFPVRIEGRAESF